MPKREIPSNAKNLVGVFEWYAEELLDEIEELEYKYNESIEKCRQCILDRNTLLEDPSLESMHERSE